MMVHEKMTVRMQFGVGCNIHRNQRLAGSPLSFKQSRRLTHNVFASKVACVLTSLSLLQTLTETQHTPAASKPLTLISISLLLEHIQIIPGVTLLLSFQFYPLAKTNGICHDNTHILDHILHHLNSSSLRHTPYNSP